MEYLKNTTTERNYPKAAFTTKATFTPIVVEHRVPIRQATLKPDDPKIILQAINTFFELRGDGNEIIIAFETKTDFEIPYERKDDPQTILHMVNDATRYFLNHFANESYVINKLAMKIQPEPSIEKNLFDQIAASFRKL